MTRTRTLAASILLAGLATPLATTAEAAAGAAPVVRAFVAYGDKAVTVPKNTRGVVRFHGRQGDMVSLSGIVPARARLFHAGRRVDQRWDGGGLFRLPSTGAYAFRVGIQHYRAQEVGLLKVRLHRLETDGPAVRTPNQRRGFIDMAVVRMSRGDRITVDSKRTEQRVYLSNGDQCVGYGGPLMLRTGHAIRVADDLSAICDAEAVRGRTLLRVRSGRRVTAASALEVAVRPDGDTVALSAERPAARELVFSFAGAADDLVYFDELGGPAVTRNGVLDRWEAPVSSLLTTPADRGASFFVATSGPTEISTVTTAVRRHATAKVRLRKAIRVPDLVTDGPAVDVPFDGSGTRLYSVATGEGQRIESTNDVGPGQSWTVEMGPRAPWSCGQEPGGPMGCGDNGYLQVTDSIPSASSLFYLRAPVAVAFPALGVTGTVSLKLLRPPTS